MKDRTDSRGDLRIVLRDVGALLVLAGALMGVPLVVAALYREYYSALGFLVSGAVTVGAGGFAYRSNRDAPEPKQHHAFLIASSGWLLMAAFGALPFVLTAHLTPDAVAGSFVPAGEAYPSSLVHLRNPLHAFFESMSAYTTTGLTMCVHEPSIGRGMLFYRSFAQWLGGAGVIVLSLAILRRPGGMSQMALYESEAAGIKLRPSILGTARAIWKIYLLLTLAVAAYLAAGTLLLLPEYGLGAALFDAVNHAMTAQSTGGFSTLDDSIAGYRSYAMELLHIPPMLLGAVSIPVFYHLLYRRDPGILRRDVQVRALLVCVAVGVPALGLLLAAAPAFSGAAGDALFHLVSALTTTGWQTSDIGAWGDGAVLFLVAPMIVGGSAGATVGGIKLIRAYLIGRGIGWRIRRAFLPKEAVLNVPLGDRTLSSQEWTAEIADAASFSILYVAILGLSVIIVSTALGPDVTLADVIFEAASAQGTVGLSSNITGPEMPVAVEVLFIVQMWLGRLEIFPVLVLLRALFVGIRRR